MKKEDAKVVAYQAPTSIALELSTEGVLCGSEFGNPGAAGANGSVIIDGDF